MLRTVFLLFMLEALPAAMSAQSQDLSSDASVAVIAALRYARHHLVGPRKHVSVERLQLEKSQRWSPAQVELFRAVLAAEDTAHAGVEPCDDAQTCRLDDSSAVVSVGVPVVRGDTITVVIQSKQLDMKAPVRIRFSLRGHQYTLVRRGTQWRVVRSDLVLVT